MNEGLTNSYIVTTSGRSEAMCWLNNKENALPITDSATVTGSITYTSPAQRFNVISQVLNTNTCYNVTWTEGSWYAHSVGLANDELRQFESVGCFFSVSTAVAYKCPSHMGLIASSLSSVTVEGAAAVDPWRDEGCVVTETAISCGVSSIGSSGAIFGTESFVEACGDFINGEHLNCTVPSTSSPTGRTSAGQPSAAPVSSQPTASLSSSSPPMGLFWVFLLFYFRMIAA